MILLLSASAWTWLIVLLLLVIGGYFFLNKLMSKGIYEESTEGRSRVMPLSLNCRRCDPRIAT